MDTTRMVHMTQNENISIFLFERDYVTVNVVFQREILSKKQLKFIFTQVRSDRLESYNVALWTDHVKWQRQIDEFEFTSKKAIETRVRAGVPTKYHRSHGVSIMCYVG